MSGALGITNPFATNYPDLMKIDESIARQQYNRLLGEDLRSQIAERQAAIAYRQATPDYGPRVGETQGAAPGGGTAPAPPRTAYGAGGPGSTITVPPEYMPYYEEAEKRTGIPKAILIAQHRQESGFNIGATGSAGEIGIGQIKPSTARAPGYGVTPIANPDQLRDPRTNILFAEKIRTAPRGANVDWNDPAQVALALQRYNSGGDPNYVANVTRYMPAPGGTQQATTAPPAAPGGQPPAGPGVVAGPGGAPPGMPSAADAVKIGSAGRRLLAMPEPEAAAAYPAMLQELRASGLAMPNAPATYPGHAAVQQLVDRLGTGAAQPPAAQGQPAASAAPAPQAPAASAVPPPTPPPRTNEQGLTNNDQDRLGEYRRSPSSTVQGEAAMRSQMVQRNEALKAAYRNELQQDAAARTAAQTHAENVAQRELENKRAADAAARAGLPPGWKMGPDGKTATRIEGLPAEATGPFPGQAEPAQLRNTLLTKDPKSPEFHAAWEAYANPHEANGVLVQGHNMEPFKLPLDADGNPVTTYAKPPMTIGPGDLTQLRKIETEAGSLTSALDEFAKVSKQAGVGEMIKTVAGVSTDLRSAWTNAALMAKGEALFNLGVLSGPDMTVIRGALADPSTFFGATASQDTVDKQVGRIKRLLQTRLDQARQSYGRGAAGGPAAETKPAPPEATPAPGTRPPLSSFAR